MITVTGVNELNGAFRRMAIGLSGPVTKLRIARAGAPPIVEAIKRFTPKYSKKYHSFRRKDGTTVKIMAGNARLSMQDLSVRRKKLADKGIVVIGPRYGRTTGKVLGRNQSNAIANYAHMILGGAKAFGAQVSERAVSAAGAASVALMEKEVDAVLNEIKQRVGL